MSYSLCSISGEIPRNPVFCPKTHLIYEKELIVNYIKVEGKCPITNTPIEVNDLFEIKNDCAEKPKNNQVEDSLNSAVNTINSLIKENEKIKNDIIEMKKELSYQNYRYEASIKIINKLIKDQ